MVKIRGRYCKWCRYEYVGMMEVGGREGEGNGVGNVPMCIGRYVTWVT